MVQGEVGPYKIAYIKDGKIDILYSRMFDKIEDALDFGHKSKSRWLLFQKVGHQDADYAWKLLPYGAYKNYKIAAKMDKLRIITLFLIAMAVIYLLSKLLKKRVI